LGKIEKYALRLWLIERGSPLFDSRRQTLTNLSTFCSAITENKCRK